MMVSAAEATILTTVGLAAGKAMWDNRRAIGELRSRVTGMESGVAVLLADRGYDPEKVMQISGDSPLIRSIDNAEPDADAINDTEDDQ